MKCGKSYNFPEGTTNEDSSINMFWEIIEIESEYNDVYVKVHNDKYVNPDIDEELVEKFTGGIIEKNDKYGYVDENVNIIIPIIYNDIFALTRSNEFYNDATGEMIEIDYSNYFIISNHNGKGIVNKKGEILIECQYRNIMCYGENTFVVTKDVNDICQMGVVDINNNIVIDFMEGSIINEMDFVCKSFAVYAVSKNDREYREGVVDRNFNVILQPIYSNIMKKELVWGDYHETYFVVEKDDKRAVLDVEGNIKIDYCDESVYDLWNNYERAVKDSLDSD